MQVAETNSVMSVQGAIVLALILSSLTLSEVLDLFQGSCYFAFTAPGSPIWTTSTCAFTPCIEIVLLNGVKMTKRRVVQVRLDVLPEML